MKVYWLLITVLVLNSLIISGCLESEKGKAGPKGAIGQSGIQGPMGICEREVVPRYVLRDKDGNAVPINVQPGYSDSYTPGNILEPGEELSYLSFQPVSKMYYAYPYYALETGRIEDAPEYKNYESWQDPELSRHNAANLYFGNDYCQGIPFALNSSNITKVDGEMYYTSGQGIRIGITENQHYSAILPDSMDCVQTTLSIDGYVFQYKLVPEDDEILSMFPNAPYTLAMEY